VDSKLTIAVVEDHDDLRELTCMALTERGHEVQGFASAEDMTEQISGGVTDVFLLDLNLPGEDGISLAKRIRQTYPLAGVVMLTARSQSIEKVLGYEAGADLYMTKPVDLDELCAAIQGFARRRSILPKFLDKHERGHSLTLQKLHLTGASGSSHLTAAEADLLIALAHAPSCRLETDRLIKALGTDTEKLQKSTLEVRIVRLRKKLHEVGAGENAIESVRNFGYQLNTPILIA
jgi:DNA-binding response OmpR family regulator